ncbi:MAG: glycosyltransferase family 2 protein [Rhizobiaceae bacterium]|nr:glycosyltransferase family 2 protein [Rhizobiaceae bacterium]MCV0408602.1 glycosyltransferase family 2 protein [Rhizobiaceae bacterium]
MTAPPKSPAAAGRVTLVTVSYNSAAALPGLLGSIPRGVEAILVDNGSVDDTSALAKRHGARLARLDTNQGFGRGCNAGARLSGREFLFFVNPDAVLAEGCVERLVAASDAMPDAAAFNPTILDGGGRRRKIRARTVLARPLADPHPVNGLLPVPTLNGGALFCRRAAFEAVGGFDPAIFLYHEDDDLAVRLAQEVGPLFIMPEAVVHHAGGHSSGRSAAVSRFKGYHMARARAYVMAKHGHALAAPRTVMRALAELALPHNLLSSRRRAKHLGQLAGAWSALADGGAFHDA